MLPGECVEDIAHLRREITEAERLCYELHAFVQPAVVEDGIARITGREKNLQSWA
jgi:hypothetical protein